MKIVFLLVLAVLASAESPLEFIKRHEGLRLEPYRDSHGWSVGYGHFSTIKPRAVTREEADAMLIADFHNAQEAAVTAVGPSLYSHPPNVRFVLINMAYQLGYTRLIGFKRMLAAVHARNYKLAAAEILDSTWHRQTPKRCEELAAIMNKGDQP